MMRARGAPGPYAPQPSRVVGIRLTLYAPTLTTSHFWIFISLMLSRYKVR